MLDLKRRVLGLVLCGLGVLAFPAVASDTTCFAGFEFGSTNRTYSMRVLDIQTASGDPVGYLDAFGTTNLLCDLRYGSTGGLVSVGIGTNGPRWPGSLEKFAEVIHRVISELERYNGGTLYGWPEWGFVNVDPPAAPSPDGFPLHVLWDLVQGEFGEHCLDHVVLCSVSGSGLMIGLSVDTCGRWHVSVRMEDEYHKLSQFRGDLAKKLMRREVKIKRSDKVYGDDPPPCPLLRSILGDSIEGMFRKRGLGFRERGLGFMRKLDVRPNRADRTIYRWRAPEEFVVGGKTYLLGMDSSRGVVVEKGSGRLLRIGVRIEESCCEADSVIGVFERCASSSMPDDIILKKLSCERFGEFVLVDGLSSFAVLKNITVEVWADSDGLAFAKAILNAGWRQRVAR